MGNATPKRKSLLKKKKKKGQVEIAFLEEVFILLTCDSRGYKFPANVIIIIDS